MTAYASVDGRLTPLAEAVVPITDRGFLYGDHVFEVALALGGALVDGPAHLARLADGAARLGLPSPPPRLPIWIDAAVAATAAPRAAVRVVWTRGDGAGLLPRADAVGRAVVIVEPIAAAPPAALRLATLAIDRGGRGGALVPASVKSGNYLGSILAVAAAEAAGADDALLVDPDDHARETATGNVAIVEGGAVVFARGACLAGVTAARVAALARTAGVAVSSAPITRARVCGADEIFVTSSRRGVVAVVAVDDRGWAPGRTTARLAALYQAWIDAGHGADAPAPAAL